MNAEWWEYGIHVLAYPVYQILSTTRHESAHAVTAWLFGFKIIAFKVFPHRHNGEFLLGRVNWRYDAVEGAMAGPGVFLVPYYVDGVFVLAYLILRNNVELSFHWLAFATVMLLISPLIDVGYNLLKWKLWDRGDFAQAKVARENQKGSS